MTEWIFVGVGALFMVLAIPLITRRVRANWWYGVRTAHTLSDDRVWYEANARSGRALFVLGAGLVALAAIPINTWLKLALAMAGVLGVGLWSIALARSLYQRWNGRPG